VNPFEFFLRLLVKIIANIHRALRRRGNDRTGAIPLCICFALSLLHAGGAAATVFPVSLAGFGGEGKLDRPVAIFHEPTLGETYVADAGHQRIAAYDSTGSFIFDIPIWSEGPQGVSRLEPCAVAVDATGRVFVATNAETVVRVYDPRGSLMTTLASPESGDPPPRPRILFVDPSQRIHVLWSGAKAPWTIYASDLLLVVQAGSYGSDPGSFQEPTGLWVDGEGRTYICDASSVPAVKVFGPDQQYLFGFGGHEVAHGDFSLPAGITTTQDGSIWVTDRLRQVIKQFDAKGNFLTMIGGWGGGPGELRYPVGLSGDGESRVFVAENGNSRFQVYTIPTESASMAPSSETP
jgi:streptogramin lyase